MVKKISTFLGEVRAELGKVAWSTREEVLASTAVVFMMIAIMAVFIGVVDIALSHIVRLLFR